MLHWLLFPTIMSSARIEELVQYCSPQKFTFQQTYNMNKGDKKNRERKDRIWLQTNEANISQNITKQREEEKIL